MSRAADCRSTALALSSHKRPRCPSALAPRVQRPLRTGSPPGAISYSISGLDQARAPRGDLAVTPARTVKTDPWGEPESNLAVSVRSLKRKPLVLTTLIHCCHRTSSKAHIARPTRLSSVFWSPRVAAALGSATNRLRETKSHFVAPRCHPIVHEAMDGACVLFSFSHRVVQEKLRIWRERRENF